MSGRVRLEIEYDGTAYSGWQRQANAPSVQGEIERALGSLTGEKISVTGASRTDAGVHALGQVAHFDTGASIPPDKYSYALNTRLPRDIRVTGSGQAAPDFHSRYHARAKIYRYVFYCAPHASAIYRDLSAHVMYPVDFDLVLGEVARAVGRHDFSAFAAAGSEAKTTVRTVMRADAARRGDRLALFFMGDGFLYNMVRILAGTAAGVGCGKIPPGATERAILSGNRLDLGVTAPPGGLCLMRVFYDDDISGAENVYGELLENWGF